MGRRERSRCKLLRQSEPGSDNETRAHLRVKSDYLPDGPAIQLQTSITILAAALRRATKLSRRQQQLQKHRPPHIPATISCSPNQVMKPQQHSQNGSWAGYGLTTGCTYDLISPSNSSALHAQSLRVSWSKFHVR